MAFVSGNFRMVGGGGFTGNQTDGGQSYSVVSPTDTVETMLAAGYLDTQAGTLNAGDSVLFSGTNGNVSARVGSITAGVVTMDSAPHGGSVQALSGAGAIDIITAITEVTSTGADALTLVDGAIGQTKIITLLVDGGTATLTPTTGHGYSTIAFADAGDSVTLLFNSLGWAITGSGGLAGGPVAA